MTNNAPCLDQDSQGPDSALTSVSFLRERKPLWTMLVCSDLGFLSPEPRRVLIAQWNDLLRSCKPVLRGMVPGEPGMGPVPLEHPVSTLEDLTPQAIESSLPHVKPIIQLRAVVADVLNRSLKPMEAIERIRSIRAPSHYRTRALSLLSLSQARPQDSTFEKNLTDALRSNELGQLVSELDIYRQQESGRALEQAFVNGPRAAWIALHHLATAAGRSTTFALAVASFPRQCALECMAKALDAAEKELGGIDLVLWDFPVGITMNDMKTLAKLGSVAGAHRTMVLVSVADERFHIERSHTGSFDSGITGTAHAELGLPLNFLRRNPVSRFLVVCAPMVRLETEQKPSPVCGAAWLIAHDIERQLIDGSSPLTFTVPTLEDIERNFQFSLFEKHIVSADAVVCAHAMGITLLSNDPTTPRLPLPTLAPADEGGQAFSLGYSLLVNRLNRLCSKVLAEMTPHSTLNTTTAMLREVIVSQLAAQHLISSEQAVRVTVREKKVYVHADLDYSAGSAPFSFEMELSAF